MYIYIYIYIYIYGWMDGWMDGWMSSSSAALQRVEIGAKMYIWKQSEVHLPIVLISHEGIPFAAAFVAAPMCRLWPAYSEDSNPDQERRLLNSVVKF